MIPPRKAYFCNDNFADTVPDDVCVFVVVAMVLTAECKVQPFILNVIIQQVSLSIFNVIDHCCMLTLFSICFLSFLLIL